VVVDGRGWRRARLCGQRALRLRSSQSFALRQPAQFRRAPKVLIAARPDRDVYDWLRKYGEGYSTRINNILRAVMSRMR